MSAEMFSVIVSVYLGIVCIPFSGLFLSFFLAGRIVTPKHQRSDIGRFFGWFSLCFSVLLAAVAGLTLARWADGDGHLTGNEVVVGTVLRLIGAIAITVAVPVAFRLGPLVLSKMREGKL